MAGYGLNRRDTRVKMRFGLVALALATTLAMGALPAAADDDDDELQIYGLTTAQTLIVFEADDPQDADTVGPVSGLASGDRLLGIDFRPRTGELYGLGQSGRVYTIDTSTAVATFRSQLTVLPVGNSFGIDFDPTVDRLRVISDQNQNLRVNVDTGATTTDTPLNYSATDPNTGKDPVAVGAAYTNNDNDEIVVAPATPTAGKTGTSLFDIDSALDVLVLQSPPNSGTLNTIGSLGTNTNDFVGFDIYSEVTNGATTSNTASCASLSNNGRSALYQIDLATGSASKLGPFTRSKTVVDIAVPQAQVSDGDDDDDDDD